MKIKVLLIVLLVGVVCFVGFSVANDTEEESPRERLRRALLAKVEAERQRNERLEEYLESMKAQHQRERQRQLEFLAERRRERGQRPPRLTLARLEARVINLEHAVAEKLSTTGVPPDLLEDFLYAEKRKQGGSMAEIQHAVHIRILDLAEGLQGPRELRRPEVR